MSTLSLHHWTQEVCFDEKFENFFEKIFSFFGTSRKNQSLPLTTGHKISVFSKLFEIHPLTLPNENEKFVLAENEQKIIPPSGVSPMGGKIFQNSSEYLRESIEKFTF